MGGHGCVHGDVKAAAAGLPPLDCEWPCKWHSRRPAPAEAGVGSAGGAAAGDVALLRLVARVLMRQAWALCACAGGRRVETVVKVGRWVLLLLLRATRLRGQW
eukprot:scaffold95008_cov14-Tisochrysis_lutea.AAC.1